MKILADRMTNEWVPILTELTPDSGCYMSEARRNVHDWISPANHIQADPQQPDWRQAFFGSNYDSLYAIKTKYDPFRTFYAPTAVGSDDWQVEADGRLCRAKSN
jgi:hypothetical protein